MNKEQLKEYHRQYYEAHKESIIAKRMDKYYSFKEKWYKNVICYMCGNKINIHYHHLDPSTKVFTIAEKWYGSDEEIQKEIDKCIPLCGNCHKIVHMIVNPLLQKKISNGSYLTEEF